MDLKIRLFATLKDQVGADHIIVSMALPATVATVMAVVVERYPNLETAVLSTIIAVNKEFADDETIIHPYDDVALFPPVSGGQEMAYPTYFAITKDEPDLNAIRHHLTQPDVGAIVSFNGSVRGKTEREGLPNETLYLEYEAYHEMAEVKMAQIAREIWAKWPLVKGVAIVQRIGALDIGEVTTVVACASGHRDQGVFDATLYGIDRLKEIVPVWKKEVGSDKQVWIEGQYKPTSADNG